MPYLEQIFNKTLLFPFCFIHICMRTEKRLTYGISVKVNIFSGVTYTQRVKKKVFFIKNLV